MPKILDPESAVGLASRCFEKSNYLQTSKSKDSRYFGKRGSPWRIRVSNHIDPRPNTDVLVDIVFDYATIEQDVEVRVGKAITQFERKAKMRWLETKSV